MQVRMRTLKNKTQPCTTHAPGRRIPTPATHAPGRRRPSPAPRTHLAGVVLLAGAAEAYTDHARLDGFGLVALATLVEV